MTTPTNHRISALSTNQSAGFLRAKPSVALSVMGLISLGVVGLGCSAASEQDDDETLLSSASGDSQSCEMWCAKLELCFDIDESDCVEDCIDDRGYESSYTQLVATCHEEASCNEISNQEVWDCVDDGVRRMSPSVAGEEYCSDLGSVLDECNDQNDRDDVIDECIEFIAIHRDSFIEASTECLDDPCDEILECSYEAADDVNTASILWVGEPSCCTSSNLCEWSNDGRCDCYGLFSWDSGDCSE